MIARAEIDRNALKHKVGPIEIEKDYVITWILYGISKNEELRSVLAFKRRDRLEKNIL